MAAKKKKKRAGKRKKKRAGKKKRRRSTFTTKGIPWPHETRKPLVIILK